jgi:hypothetical protein
MNMLLPPPPALETASSSQPSAGLSKHAAVTAQRILSEAVSEDPQLTAAQMALMTTSLPADERYWLVEGLCSALQRTGERANYGDEEVALAVASPLAVAAEQHHEQVSTLKHEVSSLKRELNMLRSREEQVEATLLWPSLSVVSRQRLLTREGRSRGSSGAGGHGVGVGGLGPSRPTTGSLGLGMGIHLGVAGTHATALGYDGREPFLPSGFVDPWRGTAGSPLPRTLSRRGEARSHSSSSLSHMPSLPRTPASRPATTRSDLGLMTKPSTPFFPPPPGSTGDFPSAPPGSAASVAGAVRPSLSRASLSRSCSTPQLVHRQGMPANVSFLGRDNALGRDGVGEPRYFFAPTGEAEAAESALAEAVFQQHQQHHELSFLDGASEPRSPPFGALPYDASPPADAEDAQVHSKQQHHQHHQPYQQEQEQQQQQQRRRRWQQQQQQQQIEQIEQIEQLLDGDSSAHESLSARLGRPISEYLRLPSAPSTSACHGLAPGTMAQRGFIASVAYAPGAYAPGRALRLSSTVTRAATSPMRRGSRASLHSSSSATALTPRGSRASLNSSSYVTAPTSSRYAAEAGASSGGGLPAEYSAAVASWGKPARPGVSNSMEAASSTRWASGGPPGSLERTDLSNGCYTNALGTSAASRDFRHDVVAPDTLSVCGPGSLSYGGGLPAAATVPSAAMPAGSTSSSRHGSGPLRTPFGSSLGRGGGLSGRSFSRGLLLVGPPPTPAEPGVILKRKGARPLKPSTYVLRKAAPFTPFAHHELLDAAAVLYADLGDAQTRLADAKRHQATLLAASLNISLNTDVFASSLVAGAPPIASKAPTAKRPAGYGAVGGR